MKTLYLMRHGETLFNQQKKIQGWCDSPLTELGKKQALVAREYFIANNINLHSAYASTSERACDTLELVTNVDYTRVKGLKEWNFGALEAEHEYLNPPLPYGDFFVDFGGEGELEFRARVSQTIFDLVQKDAGENILMVSHGASCRQFMRVWDHTSRIDLPGRIANCCILKFAFEKDQFALQEIVNHDFTSVL
ncbi:histidine phosphatase family protein [Candidatus Enterococcus murrayae]|uniref:Histidine phosphatase family protein n=1 Tax=Candidatus Enterococcus murrayae TaxID=2815321 RepID=A0ABS3HFP7_9ENTE|nr:histidine phosphatase family protein [Enterococcus sp. MJM16]MBO0452269.1 histidine phosphatase family protein [Enterococcus sp. MJM16]